MTLEIQNETLLSKNRQVQEGIVQNNGNFQNMDTNAMKQQLSQSDAVISFLRAARSGDLSKVLEFLESGQIKDINACNANGLNALHLAAKDGYIDIVSELLRRGIAVDNATKKGNTALHIASLAGQREVLKLLLQYNANVNVQSLNGFTPLYMAAQENHDSCVRFLLAKGANPSLATEDGFTPLAVAMQQGHDKVVAVLLESDVRGKVRLPALHIAAKKNDVTAASLLLQNEQNADVVSKSGFTPLHIAAHYGNVEVASLLIERGADVNFTAKHNITPLHVAAKWGKTNILQLLLSKGARIDATTRDGLTPLHCAARSGHTEVIEILLNSRPAADSLIHARTKNGLAPLHMAAQGEHDASARMLLEHNAPVDDVTVDYLTALHVAAHCGHVRVAKLLLDFSADPNARALNGFTPLHIACKKNRIKIVELLLKHGASISATTESGLTPLHVASFMGCMNIVIYLLQHEANSDAVTVRGETPLHLAARANQSDIIRILLRNGAQVDARAREGQTPLHVASRLGNVDIIMLMLQHGADVEAATRDGYTPLHIAAKEGQLEIVNVLIDQNAQLESVTKKGFSPLHLAAKYGKEKVVHLLLQKGAKVDSQGKNDVTPLHVAVHYDHPQVVQLLLEEGNATPNLCAKNGHSALHIAAKKNQMDIAQQLLQHKADVGAHSKAGFTPLHLAAQEGHVDMVQLLIEHGADPNAIAKNGLSPMHLCAQEDNIALARLLLDNGAHISERTKAGYTPLHIAAHYGQVNMVKFLLENDANIEMTTNVGYTPLHQASQQGHTMVINLLLRYRANPNAITNDGHTALSIANSLGYVTAVETLKVVTETSITNTLTGVLVEEKYKVVAPESMHETFLSDSEDECGEDHLIDQQHQYRLQYMATDDLKTHQDTENQMHYDTTSTDGHSGQPHAEVVSSNHVDERAAYDAVNVTVNKHENAFVRHNADNVAITRPPLHLGFLVSFLVDARGGSMRGCRHHGVRVIVPAKACPQPTRITCRYVKPQRVVNQPPLMEGEALVSRILELSPVDAKFLGPVILEIPHFGSLRNKEREIIILRSENGDTWREHTLNEESALLESILQESGDLNPLEDLHTNRIVRIVTRSFPHFFAVVSRIRQEVHAIGPDGGTVSSKAVPQVQAIFPPNALTKKIRVGLQANAVDLEVCSRLLGQGVAVTPVVTLEPRRRKFHKAITLSIPAPKANTQGMVNTPYTNSNAPTLRLLCSITGGQNRAVWEDVTGSTPLAFVKDSVTFTTTVSARFWLMDCRNVSEASRMATQLYTYMTQVPFMVKFVVFAKRISPTEAKVSIFCMTDDKEDKTLEQQEAFAEVAKSRDVEVLEEQEIFLEFAGQLVPVLKSGEQLSLKFQAFRENRLSFLMHIKDQDDPYGRVVFCNSPKANAGEVSQRPICMLDISLKGLKEQQNSLSTENILSHIDHGVSYRDLINSSYKNKMKLEANKAGKNHHQSVEEEAAAPENDKANFLNLSLLNYDDLKRLADELHITIDQLNQEIVEKPTQQLHEALVRIGRADVIVAHKSMDRDMSPVNREFEKSFDQKQVDQSAFDDLSKYLNDSVETYIIEKQAEENVEKLNDMGLSKMSPSPSHNAEDEKYPTAKDVCQTLPFEKNEQQDVHHDDLELIRLVAEEHTKQLLEEAQRNIENGARINGQQNKNSE